MSKAERILRGVVLGYIGLVFLWAASGSLFGFFFNDDFSLLGHYGRGGSYYGVDLPY